MEMQPDAQDHIENDRLVWFTSVTDAGAPAPQPGLVRIRRR